MVLGVGGTALNRGTVLGNTALEGIQPWRRGTTVEKGYGSVKWSYSPGVGGTVSALWQCGKALPAPSPDGQICVKTLLSRNLVSGQ